MGLTNMNAEDLVVFLLSDDLCETPRLDRRCRALPIAEEGEGAHLHVIASCSRAFFSVKPTEATCGEAVGGAGDPGRS